MVDERDDSLGKFQRHRRRIAVSAPPTEPLTEAVEETPAGDPVPEEASGPGEASSEE